MKLYFETVWQHSKTKQNTRVQKTLVEWVRFSDAILFLKTIAERQF